MPVDIRSNRIEAGFFNYMDKKRIAWNKGLKGVMPVPWNKGKKTSKATKLKQSKARMGKIPWNKGMKGLQVGWNKDKKMPEITGKNNCNWKGNKAGYFAIHAWVIRQKGYPEICEHCGVTSKEKRLNWANKDHTYKRDVNDYIPLCVSCHRKYNIKYNNYKFSLTKSPSNYKSSE